MEEKINFARIEKKWQDRWEKAKCFEVKEDSKKKKYYVLEQFPYPSGTGLHMGHSFVYTIGDIYARFKRMQGFNVLHPIGFDALGLPAENAAIRAGVHPEDYTDKSTKYFLEQMKKLGFSYDWSRLIYTTDPQYYRWDQWIFLKMFEKGLAYRKKSSVNWCPKCRTVLANEQVHDGRCEYHGDTNVEIKHLEQWYLKITNYNQELANFETVEQWPDLIKKLQKNWIGKSYGTEIEFEINGEKWQIFTTRPDTIYGVTFMVISAQHPRLMEIVNGKQKKEVENFLKKIKSVSEKELEEMEKEGVFTGSYAINPVNNEKIPVYAGNFVVADYGSGMVMAVPSHDQRDFEFAKKYNIAIREVIQGGDIRKQAYIEKGILVNSGKFTGMGSEKAKEEITKFLENKKLGRKTVNFRLRDWLVSRQRYWGTPIPIIYCDKCGIVPVPEKDLPVKLPREVKFGDGNPLATNKDFVNTKCPRCGGKAMRETDTMDTFVNSSWYFLRYCDAKNNQEIFDKKKANYWMPIDIYIGGKEHACMHDIYMRFYTKFLRDLRLLKIDEPAIKLFVQGIVHGEDGNKMSKSLGNVVDPMELIKDYNADSLRLFLISNASPESDFNWRGKGIQGSFKFLNRVFENFSKLRTGKSSESIESKINKAVKEVSEDISGFKYNLAIIKLRELFDRISGENVSKKDAETFLKLVSPFCPHISEELWEKLGNKGFISLESWPAADESKINLKLEQEEKNVEKLCEDILNIVKIIRERDKKEMKRAYVYTIPSEFKSYKDNLELINKKTGLEISVFAVNDKGKHDPENKAGKAKLGKPAIYLE